MKKALPLRGKADLKEFNKLKDYQAIKSYCGKGDENKLKTTANRPTDSI